MGGPASFLSGEDAAPVAAGAVAPAARFALTAINHTIVSATMTAHHTIVARGGPTPGHQAIVAGPTNRGSSRTRGAPQHQTILTAVPRTADLTRL